MIQYEQKGGIMTTETNFYVVTDDERTYDCNGAMLFEVGDKIINRNGEWTVQYVNTSVENVRETKIFNKIFKKSKKLLLHSTLQKIYI